ncbi:DUF1203 domain-containing protein [Sulfitobacter sp. LCG007]
MLRYIALPTHQVRALQAGAPDAYGNTPERGVSNGAGNPCRHCLRHIPAGAGMLILSHCPFPTLQPYAETGPIFLCENACQAGGGSDLPAILTTSADYLLKGYGPDERIVYGTGGVVSREDLADRAQVILDHHGVASVHVRSARNNCYLLRIFTG